MINSPFNYTGNKFILLPQILPLLDYSKNNFVDLFTGGGSVYINLLDKFEKVYVNDIIKELVLIHQNIKDDNFIEKVKLLCVKKDDKEGYLKLRDSFNLNKNPEKLYALMLCCTNNMMRFNKQFLFNQTFGERTFNDNTQKKIDLFSEQLKKYNNIIYSYKSFIDFDVKVDTHYYVDPPYSNTEAGYNSYWNKNDDEKLFNFLIEVDKVGSTFAVSGVKQHNGDSCKLLDMLELNGFKIHNIKHDYEKVARKKDKNTQEVLITNY